MINPFEQIEKRLAGIEALLIELKHTPIQQNTPEDRIHIDEICQITGLSKSLVYKLSMKNEIPVSRYHGRLVSSRKNLMKWREERTISKNSIEDPVSQSMAKAAKKHLEKC